MYECLREDYVYQCVRGRAGVFARIMYQCVRGRVGMCARNVYKCVNAACVCITSTLLCVQYFPHENHSMIAVMVHLEDAAEVNGCICAYPKVRAWRTSCNGCSFNTQPCLPSPTSHRPLAYLCLSVCCCMLSTWFGDFRGGGGGYRRWAVQ